MSPLGLAGPMAARTVGEEWEILNNRGAQLPPHSPLHHDRHSSTSSWETRAVDMHSLQPDGFFI